MKIREVSSSDWIECDILLLSKSGLPKKKDGWIFSWRRALKKSPSSTYALVQLNNGRIHGMMQLVFDEGMLNMELLESAPFNIGKDKKYDRVAGCLIAYACREAIRMTSAYKGYVTFISKSVLVDWYIAEYYATQTIGQRMYIDPHSGKRLIDKYLK